MNEHANTDRPAALTVHANLWIETAGKVALSRWRVQLLEAVAETGSIRAAAKQMQITYDLAWHRLDEMEQALGVQLVARQRGGAGGGSAQLTAAGRDYMTRFQQFAAEIDAIIAQRFADAFGEAQARI